MGPAHLAVLTWLSPSSRGGSTSRRVARAAAHFAELDNAASLVLVGVQIVGTLHVAARDSTQLRAAAQDLARMTSS